MRRPLPRSLAPTLLACAALVSTTGCKKEPEPAPTVTPEPEPEPEPEPPKPSNEPSQTWEQQWATPSGKPTGNLVGIRNGHVYALAGEFVEMGTPATHLVAFAEDTGAVAWTYASKAMLTATGASDVLVAVTADEKPVYVAVKTGKKAKPKKGEADAITPFDTPAAAEGVTANGATLTGSSWTVTEAGALADLTSFNDAVCYAVAGAREVRCRAMTNGDLLFAVAVPAVAEVKEPEAVNFQFLFANEKLYISNYDGTVLAFAQTGAGADAAADPAEGDAEADADASE